ncbi:hypothetical protein D9758_004202 [Tetrapyrgos nigripes]|uniref:DNA helicase n=1 Tax=Tetrapyrgos nigripes TaxID=182062 RepID=A0A8H5GU72_9AGAR|nr:hypothetical protein D9758_004202 [Tetrapyrgos nigripes]
MATEAGESQPLLHTRSQQSSPYRWARGWKPNPYWLIPVAMVMNVSRGMTMAMRVQVYTDIACASLGLPNGQCAEAPEVQARAARIQASVTTIMSILSAIATGPWSRWGDIHGRTPLLMLTVFGALAMEVAFLLVTRENSVFSRYAEQFIMVGPVIDGFVGGLSAFNGAVHAYISDCTPHGSRARIFSTIQGLVFIGLATGPWITGFILSFGNFSPYVAFYASSLVLILLLAYIAMICPESLTKEKRLKTDSGEAEIEGRRPTLIANLKSSLSSFMAGFVSPVSMFKPRDDPHLSSVGKDWNVTLAGGALFLYCISVAVYNIKYLYGKHVYQWNATQLGFYMSLLWATRAVNLLVLLPIIIGYFKPKVLPGEAPDIYAEMRFDQILAGASLVIDGTADALIALIPGASQNIFVALSCLSSFTSGGNPTLHSLAAVCLHAAGYSSEVGSLFGALAVVAAAAHVISPTLFAATYSSTVATFPQAIFVLAAALLFTAVLLLALIRILQDYYFGKIASILETIRDPLSNDAFADVGETAQLFVESFAFGNCNASCVSHGHTSSPPTTMSTFTVANPDDDILSDFVPSNIVSRQVGTRLFTEFFVGLNDDLSLCTQPSEPSEGESEFDAEEDDELMDEEEEEEEVGKEKPKKQTAAERAAKKEKRKAAETELLAKRQEMDKNKIADAVKRYSYLLGQTELFKHFVDIKRAKDPQYAALMDAQPKPKGRGRKKAADNSARHRKSEKEEDEELLKDVIHGNMRPYQLQGLNWMVSLHHNGLNGILADEMGLGKTLQTISFLAYLKHYRDIKGPHLIVVPKSTLQNWAREFEKWTPDFKIVLLTGSKEERQQIIANDLITQDFEVCITSYEICLIEKSTFKKFSFEYIVIDEAHRIKNVNSILSQIVRAFMSRGRMLITGTPLQNNLEELFALLNFICPEIFVDYSDLNTFLNKDSNSDLSDEEKSAKVVEALHKILRPFLLRRVKADVEKNLLPKKEINIYVGLTEMQKKWYRSVLEKDIDAVNGLTGKKEGKTRLMNMVMQLRKVTCHPYLFDGAEPGPPYTTDEHLIENCGKMIILDKLLKSMSAKGSRVLIFSQMSRVLDILEDYCLFRQYKYCRIDGGTAHDDRIVAIDEYNKPGSEKFIFLLTTRAGGLGINLTTADIVVLYDSDWNPQADLQAMDRAHRIGQTKQVYVFRFITEGSVEERMLERAAQKLRLDQLVIQQGRQQQTKAANKDELLEMITHGAEKIISSSDLLIDGDIDEIITRGEERTAELNSKYEGLNLEDLSNFKSDASVQQWEGEDFRSGRKALNFNLLSLSKRERKSNYSVDNYFKDTLRQGPSKPDKGPKLPKAPKQVNIQDFQFFPPELAALQERELAVHKRLNGITATLRDPGPDDTPESLEEERAAAQELIDTAEPLTEEEQALKDQYIESGFPDWSRRDFQQLVKGLEAYGWNQPPEVYATDIQEKTAEEVRKYYETFKQKWTTLSEYPRIATRIAEGEAKRNKRDNLESLLDAKINSVRYPMQELELNYPTTKGKVYSEEEDRYLLCRLFHYGMQADDVYERIKKDISEFPVFRFDWFFKSRSPQELQRRCNTLLSMIEKEAELKKEEEMKAKGGQKSKKRGIEEVKAETRPSTPTGSTSSSAAKRPAKKKKT